MPFPRILAQSETQTSLWIWILVADSISYVDNRGAKGGSLEYTCKEWQWKSDSKLTKVPELVTQPRIWFSVNTRKPSLEQGTET